MAKLRILAFIVISLSFTLSSIAQASGVYLGLNLALFGGPQNQPFTSGFSITPLPLPGAQVGYDLDDGPNSFGGRLGLNFLILGQVALDGYYRLRMDAGGSNAYFGAGAEYQFVIAFDAGGGSSFYGLHALLGYEWRIGQRFALFLETTPGVLFGSSGTSLAAALRGGLTVHF